jgi:hypothetical protein
MILYHYTTIEGLKGIIHSKSIWASDYRFANDATEFSYGLAFFEQAIERLRSQHPLHSDVIDVIGQFRKAIPEFSLLIASFCEHGDLLSQWRGYNGAIGYAVGVDADWLNQNAEAQGFRLVPVCYKREDQEKMIADKIGLLMTLIKEEGGPNPIWEAVNKWWPIMLLTIAAIKNEHFNEEREYRLVQAGHGWPLGICTRSTRSGLVPYLPMKLDAKLIDHVSFHPNNVGIQRIVVGPGLPKQQTIAVDALLASQHMRLEIQKSNIPYIPTR